MGNGIKEPADGEPRRIITSGTHPAAAHAANFPGLQATRPGVKASFWGPDMQRFDSLNDLLALDEQGNEVYRAIMLFLPNPYLDEAVMIGASGHHIGISKYRPMLQKRLLEQGFTQADLDASKDIPIIGAGAVDLVVRPIGGRSAICIRNTDIPRENWPALVVQTMALLQSLGIPKEQVKVLDFSPETVRHTLLTGRMSRMYELPRTLVEQEEFIERESKQTLRRWKVGDILHHATVYNGLMGDRQMLSGDFSVFVEAAVRLKPQRKNMVSALEHMVDFATGTNKMGVKSIVFFMADHEKFQANDLKAAAEHLRKKDPEQTLDEEDAASLRGLAHKFMEAVPKAFREYDSENEKCREKLLKKLLGGFSLGIRIPGLQVEYLGRGQWLPAPVIGLDGLQFPKGVDRTVRAISNSLREKYPNAEYLAPYQSIGSGSFREATSEGREVYLCVIGEKESSSPFIVHMRRIAQMDEAKMLNLMDTVTAIRLFGIKMPEYFYLTVPKGEGGTDKFFVSRRYLHDARPAEKYVLEEFKKPTEVMRREELLGEYGGSNAAIGRVTYFVDGGETFKTYEAGGAKEVVLTELDGAFQDLKTPIIDTLDLYVRHIASSMLKAHVMGADEAQVNGILGVFARSFSERLTDIRLNYQADEEHYDKNVPVGGDVSVKIKAAMERVADTMKTNPDQIQDRMIKDSLDVYGRLCALLDDLPQGPDKNEAAMALDQLLLTQPQQLRHSLDVLESDATFKALPAQEREDRIDILRLEYGAKKSSITLQQLHGYIGQLKGRHGPRTYAQFEDEVHDAFPGLNLRGKDARLIDKVFGDGSQLSDLQGKGYVSSA
ncbi:MAG: hypothetical protein V1875_08875 [Candidatus Altiarchaeota archaeon]